MIFEQRKFNFDAELQYAQMALSVTSLSGLGGKMGPWVGTSLKNQPCTGLAVDFYLLPTSKSCDTKTRTKMKNSALISFRYCAVI